MPATLTPDNKLAFRCDHCRAHLRIPVAMAGITGPCPKCGKTMTAPLSADGEATSPPAPGKPAASTPPKPALSREQRELAPLSRPQPTAATPPIPEAPEPEKPAAAAPRTQEPDKPLDSPGSIAAKEPLQSLQSSQPSERSPEKAPPSEPEKPSSPDVEVPEPPKRPSPAPKAEQKAEQKAEPVADTPVEPELPLSEEETPVESKEPTPPVEAEKAPATEETPAPANTTWSRRPVATATTAAHLASRGPRGAAGSIYDHSNDKDEDDPSVLSEEAKSIDLNEVEQVPEPRSLFKLGSKDEDVQYANIDDDEIDDIEPFEDVAALEPQIDAPDEELAPAPLGLEIHDEEVETPPVEPEDDLALQTSEEPEIPDEKAEESPPEIPEPTPQSGVVLDVDDSSPLPSEEAPEARPETISHKGQIPLVGKTENVPPEAPNPPTRPIGLLNEPSEDKIVEDSGLAERQSLFAGGTDREPKAPETERLRSLSVRDKDAAANADRATGEYGRMAKESLLAASLALSKSANPEEKSDIFIPRSYETKKSSAADVPEVKTKAPIDEPEALATNEDSKPQQTPADSETPPITPAPAASENEVEPKAATTDVAEGRPLAPIEPKEELPINDEYDEDDEVFEGATPFTENLFDGDSPEPPTLLPSLSPVDQPLLGRQIEDQDDFEPSDLDSEADTKRPFSDPFSESSKNDPDDFIDEDSEETLTTGMLWRFASIGLAAVAIIAFAVLAARMMLSGNPELARIEEGLSETAASAPDDQTLPSTELALPASTAEEEVSNEPEPVVATPAPLDRSSMPKIVANGTPESSGANLTTTVENEPVARQRPQLATGSDVVILPDPFAMMSPPNPDQLAIPPKPAPGAQQGDAQAADPTSDPQPGPEQTVIGQTIGASDWPAGGEPTPPANLLGADDPVTGAPQENLIVKDAPDAVIAEEGAAIGPISATPVAEAEMQADTVSEESSPPLLTPIQLSEGGTSPPQEDLKTLSSLAPVDGTAAIEVAEASQQNAAVDTGLAINSQIPSLSGPSMSSVGAITMPELPSVTPSALASEPIEITEPSKTAVTMLSEPRELLDKFLATTSVQERLPLFYQSEKLSDQIQAYYAANEIELFELPDVEFSSLGEDPDSDKEYYVFDVRTHEDPSFLPIVIRETSEGPKVDWDAYQDFKGRRFAKFVDGDQKGPASFRFSVARASYFGPADGDDFTTKDDYVCFRISPPYIDYERYAFVKKDSPLAEDMKEICYWGLEPDLIAVLTVEKQMFPHGVEHFVITKIDGIGLIPPVSGNYRQP